MKTLDDLIEQLTASGVCWPITEKAALRYRGIGPKALAILIHRGLVTPEQRPPIDDASAILLRQAWGLTTREQVRDALRAGTLNLERLRGVGKKRAEQIVAWATEDPGVEPAG